MPRSLALKSTLDDAKQVLEIKDFSGLLNSDADPLDLALNFSPDCENVKIGGEGRLQGRDGFIERAALAAISDGIAFFYDTNKTRRRCLWTGGNLYEIDSAWGLTLRDTACYTAGKRITWTVQIGILYFSDGYTFRSSSGIQYWNPATAAAGPIVSSGSPATIPTPACKVLRSYAGQLVLANILYTSGGLTAVDSVLWSDVLDPTTIIGTNIFSIGQGYGGEINSLEPMAVASPGVQPYTALFIGKSETGIYLLQGPLTPTDAKEVLVNAPTGVLDGATVKVFPGPNNSAIVAWLATDRQVWYTDGINADALSRDRITSELRDYIGDRLAVSPDQDFTAVMNFADHQYVLDCGNGRQYCYDYIRKSWTRYRGWPSGYYAAAKDTAGQDILIGVDRDSARLFQANIGLDDNGFDIAPYWKTPHIHCNSPTVEKVWHEVYAAWRTDTGDIKIAAVTNLASGDSASVTLLPTGSSSGGSALFDVAIFDTDLFAESEGPEFRACAASARLVYKPTNLPPALLRGSDVQLTIERTAGTAHFEPLAIYLLYLPRGHRRVYPSL